MLLEHYRLVRFTRSDVIAEGRRAAAFFKERFGVDFTHLQDEAFLSGSRVNQEGVQFRVFQLYTGGRYRLYTASTRYEAQIFNKAISDFGWDIVFTRPFQSRGTLQKVR